MAELTLEGVVYLARILARPRQNFPGQQCGYDSVFIRRPGCAVDAQERGARAFFSAKAERAIAQTLHEPFEPDRHLVDLSPQLLRDAINHLAADYRFAHCHIPAPIWPVLEKVVDSNRQIMIRWQQPGAPRHNTVAVVIGIAG